MPATDSLAYLTPDLPGVGGTLKQRPEDFLVEEQPLYEPCGEGEHVYLFIEKNGLTTMDAVHRIARAMHMHRRNIGYAGLKDKHAVTRQHLSLWLPGVKDYIVAQGIDRINTHQPRIKVLWTARHTNKIKRGHHGGNRFVIRARNVEPTHVVRAKAVLDVLEKRGVPNYVGDQRFGYRQNSHVTGRALLLGEYQTVLDEMLGTESPTESQYIAQGRERYRAGDYAGALAVWPKALRYDRQLLDALRQGKDAERAVLMMDASQRAFLVSAWQSAVFNDVLHERVSAGTFDKLLPGDLAWKHDSRATFGVDESTYEQDNAPGGRVEQGLVSPSGPLWGVEMPRASGEPGRIEAEALAKTGVTEAQLAGPPNDPKSAAEGRRRPLRVILKDPDVEGGADEHGPYIKTSFELPRGAYATMVLREVMKNAEGEGED
ncbi:MAG: tRNA pseudouridine(13) synthase TruD [Phycisphaeraceae bacterium]